nr:hypothetical protein CFP56_61495 [Quercus suber]
MKTKSKCKSNPKEAKSQSSSDDVVEVPPPVTGGALVEEVMTTQSAAAIGVSSSTRASQVSAQSASKATHSLELEGSEESSERSEGQDEESSMMAKVAAQTPKEALPQGAVVEAQTGIPQTFQRVESPPAPKGN